MTHTNLVSTSSLIGHKWRWAKDEDTPNSFWRLYVCDECGSTYQVEYFPSGEPCPEREEVSPASETGS